jgi:hypothetical protein
MGVRAASQGEQAKVLTKGSQIQVKDLSTTGALIDRLGSCIIQVKEQKQQPYSP